LAESNIYHFIPKNSNHRLVIYHQGHRGDFIHGKELIAALLNEGYEVAVFCMPLLGLNNQPTIDDARIGRLKITSHDHMKFRNSSGGI